jgi:hypothetical protein
MTFPPFDRPLRRPQIGLVENEVQRLLVRFVQRFGKRRHEAPARRIAAELGKIDHARQSRTGDEPTEGGADIGGDRHVGVFAAKHDDRVTSRAAVGAGAQSPPHAEWIHDHHPCAATQQPFDESLRRVGLARPGGTDDCDPVVERVRRQSGREITTADAFGCAWFPRDFADGAAGRMRSSRKHGLASAGRHG